MSKVTVVGAGAVGATCANVMACREVASEVVLIDIKEGLSEGKMLDMYQCSTLMDFDTKLVGATKWFIMKPFLRNSITQGILAGTGASGLFIASIYGLNETVPGMLTVAENERIGIILGAMIAGGILLSLFFTRSALNKFINMKSNKIHLY